MKILIRLALNSYFLLNINFDQYYYTAHIRAALYNYALYSRVTRYSALYALYSRATNYSA